MVCACPSAIAMGPVAISVSVVPAREMTTPQAPGAPSKKRVRARKLSGCALTTSPELSGCVRSEEHTSELQSRLHLVCRLLLEKKKKKIQIQRRYIETRMCSNI